MHTINWPESKFVVIVGIARLIVSRVSILVLHYPLLACPTEYQVFGHTLPDGLCYGTDKSANKKLNKTQYDVGVVQNNFISISYHQLCNILKLKMMKGKKIAKLRKLIKHYTITLIEHPEIVFDTFGISEQDAYKRLIRKPGYKDYPRSISSWNLFRKPLFKITDKSTGKITVWKSGS